MATISINLASSVPDFTPSQKQLDDTKLLLESYCSYLDDGVSAKIYSKPCLVTSGAAFDSLACPACGITIKRFDDDDNDEWWYEMETKLYESSDPLNEKIVMPCCHKESTAVQFNFGKDAIFTKFLVRAHDYELDSGNGELDSEQLKKLEEKFGSKLMQIIEVDG